METKEEVQQQSTALSVETYARQETKKARPMVLEDLRMFPPGVEEKIERFLKAGETWNMWIARTSINAADCLRLTREQLSQRIQLVELEAKNDPVMLQVERGDFAVRAIPRKVFIEI